MKLNSIAVLALCIFCMVLSAFAYDFEGFTFFLLLTVTAIGMIWVENKLDI